MEFMINGDKKSFENCISVIDQFGLCSGLFMNNSKTSVIWLGSRKNSPIKYLTHLGMEWNPLRFKVLGVWFTNNLKNMESINYQEKFEETKKLFLTWTKRNITPLGRIAILKSMILSKLTHLWLLLPNPPGNFMDNLQKICFAFIWNEKQDRISRRTTYKSIQEGGLSVPNLKAFVQALKISWIRKFSNTKHKWKNIVLHNNPNIINLDKFGPNITKEFDKHNPFWNEVFDSYGVLFAKTLPKTPGELLAEPLLYNDRKEGSI